jgi:hypothetical protein
MNPVCHRIAFNVDVLDAEAIHRAIAVFQRFNAHPTIGGAMIPEGASDTRGAILAEIARDWLDARGEWPTRLPGEDNDE